MAFSQGFGKMQAAFRRNAPGKGLTPFLCVAFGRAWREDAVRRMPPEIFCMAGGHTKAQSSGFRVRMAFLQGFGKGQANSRRNASRGQPNGCPLLCGLSAAYRGAKKYRIPSVSGYGILRKE